ncbi:putative family 17 glucosidase NDAI_0I02540 [Naumovozyma dairenensis CBS 421]|uniref:Glycoside hydrolase family 17 protein n=1 Tax=Naumovozyma dairenensis (strain ATCC 10597 / BCRC 20456 / CBS 421 / NBRC 0211 / NRRL Y-12639) TaxID=1071378 RepID=G0WGB1_NAUDC|nr:hypothetical protein NDAI_0I02540 [Naumovozyma dairenensis CBS 421]CCD26822.1 hypothetical protein NDAI_0I02540 [Naumovozyma dairenensis CBS 421]
MRFQTLLTVASLASSITAAPALQHHKHKRDAVTQTVQAQVTVVVGANNAGAVLQEADVLAHTTNAATTTTATPVVDTPTTTTSTTNVANVATTSTLAPSPASTTTTDSSSSTSSSGSSSGSDVSASGFKGITYSPYNSDGSCKSTSQVASDFAKLSDYGVIRLYGVDCNQVENVLQAKSSSQKLFLGIYYVDQIQSGVDTIKNAISTYGSWNDVTTVSIGNELVNGGQATASQVGSYISTGRSALTSAGYTGPVVSVDTFIAVINNPELCNYSDYMAVNAHAYFDQNTAAADSGTWLLNQIQRVWTACDGKKDVVITESGWPTKGETYGLAVPSTENQEAAISSIKNSCGSSTFLFNAYNDLWKADGEYGVEKYWGVYGDA